MINFLIPLLIFKGTNPKCLMWSGGSASFNRRNVVKSPVFWESPGENGVKWNIDASVNLSENTSAIGGVLRNHQAIFMCMFSSPIPFMEINCAEILAIHRAIKITLASDFTKFSKIIYESDSSNAVAWCNGEEGGPWNMNFHLNFIRNAKRSNQSIEIIHKCRDSNFAADALAKQGFHRHSEFIAWM